MNKTRNAFVRAGSIISIVVAVLMLLVAGGVLIVRPYLTEEIFAESYLLMDGSKHTEADGSYIIEYLDPEDGTLKEITEGEIELIAKTAQAIAVVVADISFVIGIAQMVLAILLLVSTSKGKKGTGLIISLLVFSTLSANLVSAAFMIVALCLKHNFQQAPEQKVDN